MVRFYGKCLYYYLGGLFLLFFIKFKDILFGNMGSFILKLDEI